MKRRSLIATLGVGIASLSGCSSVRLGGVLERTESEPARRELGPLTSGISAIEWVEGGELVIEATEDSSWQSAVLETDNGEWIVTGNKAPTDDELRLDPLAEPNGVRLLPQNHTLKIGEQEVGGFVIEGEIDWIATVDINFDASFAVSADLDTQDWILSLEVENTGPCGIQLQEVQFTTEDTEFTRSVSGAVVPGESLVQTVQEPWPSGESACSMEDTSVSGSLVVAPAVDEDFEYRIDQTTLEGCTTISLS